MNRDTRKKVRKNMLKASRPPPPPLPLPDNRGLIGKLIAFWAFHKIFGGGA
jgi:hypothetical protein